MLSRSSFSLLSLLSLIGITTTIVNAKPLLSRADVKMTIGYALCGYQTCDTWGCIGGSREGAIIVQGQHEIGCVEYDGNPVRDDQGGDLAAHQQFEYQLCGMTLDFYPSGDNYDYYQQNGDGTLLGNCYPISDEPSVCANPLEEGSCSVNRMFECYPTGSGWQPCT